MNTPFLLYECEEEFYEKLSLFQKILPHDWIIIRLVISPPVNHTMVLSLGNFHPIRKRPPSIQGYPNYEPLKSTSSLESELELEFP